MVVAVLALLTATGCQSPIGWGRNNVGQLGDGTAFNRLAPFDLDPGWVSVSAGEQHTVGVRTDGTRKAVEGGNGHSLATRIDNTLWAWGWNGFGQLGDGTLTNRTSPIQVGTDTWKSMAGGERHTVAIRTDGTLWAWGYNAFGQLGDGTTVNQSSPTQIGTATAWFAATAGAEFSMALRDR